MANDYISSSLGITFSRKRKEIFIFRSTIEALGFPCFIRFLLNMEKGYLAVQRCEEEAQETFLVPGFRVPKEVFRIYSNDLTRIIWQKFAWENDQSYRCYGTFYPADDLVEFNLNKAEPVSDHSLIRE